jgi:N-acetylglutamate synthase-like GNAT family acetyltransferase
MVVKLLERKEILHDSGEFYIKEAGWRETKELHKLFRETFADDWKVPPGDKFVLIAIDKNTNKIIGGIERRVDIKSASAKGVGLAVLPEFRKKQHIGTVLLETMDAELKKMGIKEVVTMPTDKSWSIFRKHGYDRPDEVKEELRMKNADEKERIAGEKLVKKL